MKTITLSAHFDGKQIILEEPHDLRPDTRLLVTVLPEAEGEGPESLRADWPKLATSGLSAAYGPDEPEYPDSMIEEPNEKYGKR